MRYGFVIRQTAKSFVAPLSLYIAGKQRQNPGIMRVGKSLLRLLAHIQQHAHAGQHHKQA